jgi:hypothetical protein
MAVRLSALRVGRSQGHSAAGRIRSIENSNDLIESRTRDLPTCSIVPQPTTLPRAPSQLVASILNIKLLHSPQSLKAIPHHAAQHADLTVHDSTAEADTKFRGSELTDIRR